MHVKQRLRRTDLHHPDQVDPHVIVIDADRAVRRSFSLLLMIRGFDISTRSTVAQTLAHPPAVDDAVLVSYAMPKLDGLTLLIRLRCGGWRGAGILMSGFRDRGLVRRMACAPGVVLLEKPVAPSALIDAILAPSRRQLAASGA